MNLFKVSKYSAENQQKEDNVSKYQKKPVVIEAFEWSLTNEKNMPDWLINEFDNGTLFFEFDDADWLRINTLEGVMKVSEGDYIIKGVHGKLYPCKPDIFYETYQKVD